MTKSFLSENIQPNGYMTTPYLSAIYIYIHTYIYLQTQSGDRAITQYYRVQQPHMGSDYK